MPATLLCWSMLAPTLAALPPAEIWLNNIRYAMLDVLRHPRPGFEEVITTHFRWGQWAALGGKLARDSGGLRDALWQGVRCQHPAWDMRLACLPGCSLSVPGCTLWPPTGLQLGCVPACGLGTPEPHDHQLWGSSAVHVLVCSAAAVCSCAGCCGTASCGSAASGWSRRLPWTRCSRSGCATLWRSCAQSWPSSEPACMLAASAASSQVGQ